MTDEEREALEQVQFNWAVSAEDVWSPIPHHVEGLHQKEARALLRAVPKAIGPARNPIGTVLQGQAGVGKTHLLRWLRQEVEAKGGYFFLLRPIEGQDFWRSAVHGVVTGLFSSPVDQLRTLLIALCDLAGISPEQRSRIVGTIPVSRPDLDALVDGLRAVDRLVASECGNTLRALVLLRARSSTLSQIGDDYLNNDGDVHGPDRANWGIRGDARPRARVLEDLSRLLALAGPTVIAVDQIDTLIVHASTALKDATAGPEDPGSRLGEVANGLMQLREHTTRCLTVVACLPGNWDLITRNAISSAADRFQVVTLQGAMPDAEVAASIVGRHLAGHYAEVAFTPPYPTWPVLPSAFDGDLARNATPRRLMQLVAEHIRSCLDAERIVELADFDDAVPVPIEPAGTGSDALAVLDDQFAKLRAEADVRGPLDATTEDQLMPQLLDAGLRAWIIEQGEAGPAFAVDPISGRRPPVHARLRHTRDKDTEDEVHYAFRAIAHPNARAVQTRITTARTDTGLGAGVDHRRLVLLRNQDWPTGRVTAATVTEFQQHGGLDVPIGESDLRTLSALCEMHRPQPRGWAEWLVSRRPAGSIELFRRTLPHPRPELSAPARQPSAAHDEIEAGGGPSSATVRTPRPSPSPRPGPRTPEVPLGRSTGDGQEVSVALESLRKHVAVFAGSGSGKTVLLRRLVEECALRGVSAIVLDPNNDLSRLGDPWPQPSEDWDHGDAARSAEYLRHTEVVVWTPGREKGRPLVFRPLPDFSPVIDDPDEFQLALDAAVASLVPRAQLTGKKVVQGRAVLREALEYFVGQGGTSLAGLVDFLAELPDNISTIRVGQKLAAEMADALQAASVTDRLFRDSGEPADPAVLLTPTDGMRARISVISFVGLPSSEQQQGFVNQLQMALFSWVKANPAGQRPLGGLFVMDEAQNFAPSGGFTPCTESTIALASQARKYGLGLVFATQAPKGLHNQITGNAATQFFGYLNAPAQIAAATELARAKGGRVDDISRLSRGQFYVAGEGMSFVKVRAPMCLSHHPASPPTAEEVLARAAARG